MTGKTFCPRISFMIGRFEPGFQWSKRIFIFGKEYQRTLDQLSLSPLSTRPLFTEGLAMSKSGTNIYSDFWFWNKKTLFTLWMRKGSRTNCQQLHRNWSVSSREIWVDSKVIIFVIFQFSDLINVLHCIASFIYLTWHCGSVVVALRVGGWTADEHRQDPGGDRCVHLGWGVGQGTQGGPWTGTTSGGLRGDQVQGVSQGKQQIGVSVSSYVYEYEWRYVPTLLTFLVRRVPVARC